MYKILYSVTTIIACTVLLSACQKDEVIQKEKEGVPFKKGQEVTLTVSPSSGTKVSGTIDNNQINFTWDSGDKILVTVGTQSAEFTLSSGAGESSASFTGKMPDDGSSFSAQFPISDPVLSSQDYVANGVPKNKMKAIAKDCTLGTPFSLEPQYSILKLNLYGTDQTIGKIVVTNTSSTAETKPSYTLNCITEEYPTGVTIGTSSSSTTPFLLVMPISSTPSKNTFNFKAEFFNNASTPSSICSFETSNPKTFVAKEVMNMAAKEVVVKTTDKPLTFTSTGSTTIALEKTGTPYDITLE